MRGYKGMYEGRISDELGVTAPANMGAVREKVRPSIATMMKTPTSRPMRTPRGLYFMVRSRGVTAHLGLTLDHFSAQRKHLLREDSVISVVKTVQF